MPLQSRPTILKLVKFAPIHVIRACSKPLRNTIKPLSKAPQTASKKNFQAKKAFIFVQLMNAFLTAAARLRPLPPLLEFFSDKPKCCVGRA